MEPRGAEEGAVFPWNHGVPSPFVGTTGCRHRSATPGRGDITEREVAVPGHGHPRGTPSFPEQPAAPDEGGGRAPGTVSRCERLHLHGFLPGAAEDKFLL